MWVVISLGSKLVSVNSLGSSQCESGVKKAAKKQCE